MKSPERNRASIIALLIALVTAALLFRGFFSLIISAIIAAYIFTPVYNRLCKKTKKPETAALLTLLVTLLVIVIPLIIVIGVTLLQATVMINDLSTFVGHHDFGRIAQELLEWVNHAVTSITGNNPSLSYKDITSFMTGHATSVVYFIIDMLKSWVGGLGSVITSIIIYMYVFTGLLVHGHKIIKLLQDLNPLGKDATDLYLGKAQAMTKAMVKGQLTIAIIQGAISAIILYLVGLPYTMFFLLILTFMSIIPLGAGILTIPMGIVMMLFGNVFGGLVVILNHVLIVTNIDNFLKPKLVPKSVRLHPALLLLAIFGGMSMFGFLGIVIGPVLIILVVTTIQAYSQQVANAK